MIWSPVANPDMLILGTAPDFLRPSPSALSVDIADGIRGPEGAYGIYGARDGVQYLILAKTSADAQPALILPLDGDLPDRLEAILRLWHMLAAKPVRRDSRMTQYQRRRFRLMMQAADGNANHATYREIAIAIYGEARVRAEPWKTSALRASVIALVRSAAALIDGGYRDLLRHRRKPLRCRLIGGEDLPPAILLIPHTAASSPPCACHAADRQRHPAQPRRPPHAT